MLPACTTVWGGARVEDLDRPLNDLQRVAARSMPLGLRRTSTNGREFFSKYFLAKSGEFKAAEEGSERRYAQILVLGDRRPYTIQIIVHVERLTTTFGSGGYSEIGQDNELAQVVRRRFLNELHKRREDTNIIDDFRVF